MAAPQRSSPPFGRAAAGDSVAAGDVIADVETDKATMEWEAQEEATSVHWLHLRHGVGGWEAGLGSHIRDVAAEFLRLSRGLNRKMPFTFNGQVLYAAPEDESADVVAARSSP